MSSRGEDVHLCVERTEPESIFELLDAFQVIIGNR